MVLYRVARQYNIALLLFFFIPVCAFAQSYNAKQVKEKSDAIFTRLTNKAIAKAAIYDTGSYYSYITPSGDTAWGTIMQDKQTQGKLLNAYTRYLLHYTYPKCSVYNTINCAMTLQLDNKLQLSETPDLSCIPDFMLKNEPCHLLTAEEAIKIAKEKYFVPSDREPSTHFWYDPKSKQFTWSIDGAYLKDSVHRSYGTQIVTLDARTGALITKDKF
ncbi:MAG: hypothetical protein ACTHJ0_00845 [Flavipsychrobacter sp.]